VGLFTPGALLLVKLLVVTVVEALEKVSMAPPPRSALLSTKVHWVTVSVPPLLSIAAPKRETRLVLKVQSVSVAVEPKLSIAPPSLEATLALNWVLERVSVPPATFAIPAPNRAVPLVMMHPLMLTIDPVLRMFPPESAPRPVHDRHARQRDRVPAGDVEVAVGADGVAPDGQQSRSRTLDVHVGVQIGKLAVQVDRLRPRAEAEGNGVGCDVAVGGDDRLAQCGQPIAGGHVVASAVDHDAGKHHAFLEQFAHRRRAQARAGSLTAVSATFHGILHSR
jgi:hypothetical protein